MGRVRLFATVFAGAAAIYAGVLLLRPGDDRFITTFTNLGMLLASTTAAAAAVFAARRQPLGRARQSWSLMAFGLASWALGDACWGGYELLAGESAPTPSLADVFYLAMLPLVFAGILLRPVTAPRAVNRGLLFLDVAVAISALAAMAWATVLGPLFASTELDPLAQAVSVAYPLGDVAIIACLLFLMLRQRSATPATMLLVLGWTTVALADALGYLPLSDTAYQTGDLLGVLWFAGLLVVALAALSDQPVAVVEPASRLDIGNPWRFVLPSAMVAGLGALLWLPGLVTDGRLPDPSEVGFALAGVLLLMRYVLGYRDAALAHAYEQLRRQEVQQLALRDPLTGAANRRAFEAALGELTERAGLGGQPFALIFTDADHFKEYNDTYGHAAGDEALRELVRLLSTEAGERDIVARVGGDEFAVLIPDVDAAVFDARVARLQATLRAGDLVKASAGGAVWDPSMHQPADLLIAADRRLYAAKQTRPPWVRRGLSVAS